MLPEGNCSAVFCFHTPLPSSQTPRLGSQPWWGRYVRPTGLSKGREGWKPLLGALLIRFFPFTHIKAELGTHLIICLRSILYVLKIMLTIPWCRDSISKHYFWGHKRGELKEHVAAETDVSCGPRCQEMWTCLGLVAPQENLQFRETSQPMYEREVLLSLTTILKLYMTLHIASCEDEINFSKLSLIKNKFSSTTLKGKLNRWPVVGKVSQRCSQ